MKVTVKDCEYTSRSSPQPQRVRTLEEDRLAMHRTESARLFQAVVSENLHDLLTERRFGVAASRRIGAQNANRGGSHIQRWYCVQTHPKSELAVFQELLQQSFVTFLPMLQSEQAKRVRGSTLSIASASLRPMFPRYVFVTFDRDVDRWRPIWNTRGVSRLMSSTPQLPTALPRGVVESLIVQTGEVGIANAEHGTTLASLDANTRARLLNGAFADFEVLVQKSSGERVQVLLNLFGRDTQMTVRRDQLVALG